MDTVGGILSVAEERKGFGNLGAGMDCRTGRDSEIGRVMGALVRDRTRT